MTATRPIARRQPRGWQHLLLALLLAAAQLVLAIHAPDHLDDDAADSCDICLVGQHLNHAQPATVPSPPVLASTPPRTHSADVPLVASPAPRPCQRGPPRLLRIA